MKKILKSIKLEKIPKQYLIGANLLVLALIALVLTIPYLRQDNFITDAKHPLIQTEARRIYDTCIREGQREECYKKEFKAPTETYGLYFSEHVLYAMQELDLQLRHCHVISHAISQIATRHQPKQWQKLLDSVNVNTCGGGFFHGILEAHAGDDPEFKIDSDTIIKICAPKEIDFRSRSCAHIMGHLSMVEWYGSSLEDALAVCKNIPLQLAQECGTGIFMEDSFQTSLYDHQLVAQLPVRDKARLDRQKERCYRYSDTEGRACWTDMAEIFVEYHNYEPDISYKECYSAPTKPEGDACYLKAVILMAISPNYDQPGKMAPACRFFENETSFYQQCLSFMNSSLMHYSPKFINRGIDLCSNVSDKFKGFCFDNLGKKLNEVVPDVSERSALCAQAPEKFLRACVREN